VPKRGDVNDLDDRGHQSVLRTLDGEMTSREAETRTLRRLPPGRRGQQNVGGGLEALYPERDVTLAGWDLTEAIASAMTTLGWFRVG